MKYYTCITKTTPTENMNAIENLAPAENVYVWLDPALVVEMDEDDASEADTIDAEEAQRDLDLIEELWDAYIHDFNPDDLDPADEPVPEWA